ncbi:protein-export chaperone SecB, partial [Streptomyces griseoluteus]
MAALIFENYIVDNLIFKNNPNFNQIDEEVQIEPNIEVEISKDKDSAIVNLEITLNKNQNNPIYIVEVSIIGIFKYNSNESEGFNFDDLLTTNAIAILFPYARSLVSDLTA